MLAWSRALAPTIVAALASLAIARVPVGLALASLDQAPPSERVQLIRANEAVLLVDPLLGERVLLARPARRIVSLTLASDILLASLVSPDRVAGVTALVDDPAYSPVVGHYPAAVARVTASAEALIGLRPDLVVVQGHSHPPTVRALVGARVPVLRLPSGRSLDEIRNAVELLAAAVHADERGRAWLETLAERRARLAAMPVFEPRPRALFWTMGFAHGQGTLMDEILRLGGCRNVASELGLRGFQRIPAELVASARPEVLIVPADDEASARTALASAYPMLSARLDEIEVVPMPTRLAESTTPDVVDAALVLRDALRAAPRDRDSTTTRTRP